MIRYTKEEREFLVEYIPGHTAAEVSEKFIKKFGRHISTNQVIYFRKNNNINCGIDTRFKKGHIPVNKGKKMSAETYAKASKTMFKKGQKPQNYRVVGSERINVDGYIEIKVKDPGKWKLKHRVIWEEHNGKIPKGMIVIFKDNNPLNCSLDNLMLISKDENLKINRIGANEYKGIEKEILLNSIRLKNAIKSKYRKGEHNE
ncbi:MAG: HNH endonuclease [Lachnospiraceae bacterium]|nr:MAG: HNH endonuclease [Lachnospiraceae bacterium]